MIRRATPADLPAIADLHVASWRAAYRGMLSDSYLDGPMQDLRDGWSSLGAGRLVLVACEEERVHGFAAFWPDHQDGAYLDNLHVDPSLRRAGIGAALLRASIAAVRARGVGSMWLSVMAQNTAARRFYAAQGGRETATFMESFDARPVAMVRVRWDDL